ncbi:hypothetical protein SAMN05660690_1014 [Geodermatophilus telluris]|uniref:Fibronectin type-III domain-containing protein n=1 Tax=Geodermatophilus telluris TaxID=1190417 RepID=A0A1G6JXG2_9ACTN|nr:hypothetical protein SAMN05660690_1014 [Geodermatophilus telluris]
MLVVAAGVVVFLLTRPVDPPTGVTAELADDGVAVRWDAVEGATGYEVRRDGDVLGTTATTSYVDDGTESGTEYRYSVTALEDGDRSETVPATDPVVTPVAPTARIALTTDGADVVVEWDTVTGADAYEVSRDGTVLATDLTDATYRDAGVPLGDHTWQVTAVDRDGAGSTAEAQSASLFTRGPWQEAWELATAFPELLPAEPGGLGWSDGTCDRAPPEGAQALVVCDYPTGVHVEISQFADRAQWQARLDAALAGSTGPGTWSYGDGPAQGDLLESPDGGLAWKYLTFYAQDLSLVGVYVAWEGHTQDDIDGAWFAEAPF